MIPVFKEQMKTIHDAKFVVVSGDYNPDLISKQSDLMDHQFLEGIALTDDDFDEAKEGFHYIDPIFKIEMGQATFSCAVPNIGGFEGYEDDAVSKEVMAACLNLSIIANRKQGYVQAVTLGKASWKKLNEAFELTPFKKAATMKTMHYGEKYDVIVWEWIAEQAPVKERKKNGKVG